MLEAVVTERVAQEAGKARLVHLAGGHRKLAMLHLSGTADMAVDLHVVGRIGEDSAGALVTHKRWSADADGEVYFDYVTRASGQLGVSSEVEISNQLIKEWKDTVSATPH